ncbi:hypothetical protein BKA70DRAFT_1222148 [Coprinopsis sp. MPI-PUGE-AT-0042]|nr:hypothetical protein BKA70DRAFT_1222148 [Coprinopsis sp. MPI-PUGE-AT-0042]
MDPSNISAGLEAFHGPLVIGYGASAFLFGVISLGTAIYFRSYGNKDPAALKGTSAERSIADSYRFRCQWDGICPHNLYCAVVQVGPFPHLQTHVWKRVMTSVGILAILTDSILAAALVYALWKRRREFQTLRDRMDPGGCRPTNSLLQYSFQVVNDLILFCIVTNVSTSVRPDSHCSCPREQEAEPIDVNLSGASQR